MQLRAWLWLTLAAFVAVSAVNAEQADDVDEDVVLDDHDDEFDEIDQQAADESDTPTEDLKLPEERVCYATYNHFLEEITPYNFLNMDFYILLMHLPEIIHKCFLYFSPFIRSQKYLVMLSSQKHLTMQVLLEASKF